MASRRHNCKLLEDFLVPSLDDGTFGDLLKWEDEAQGVFTIRWTHKAKSSWDERELDVFLAWDRMKGRVKPEPSELVKTKGRTPHGSVYDKYLVNSKQRLRAALRNIRYIKELPPTEGYKWYQIENVKDVREAHNPEVDSLRLGYLLDNPALEEQCGLNNLATGTSVQRTSCRQKQQVKEEQNFETSVPSEEDRGRYNEDETKDPTYVPVLNKRKEPSRRKSKVCQEIKAASSTSTREWPHPSQPSTSKVKAEPAEPGLLDIFDVPPTISTSTLARDGIPRELAGILGVQGLNVREEPKRKSRVCRESWVSSVLLLNENPVPDDGRGRHRGFPADHNRNFEEIVGNRVEIKKEIMDINSDSNKALPGTSNTEKARNSKRSKRKYIQPNEMLEQIEPESETSQMLPDEQKKDFRADQYYNCEQIVGNSGISNLKQVTNKKSEQNNEHPNETPELEQAETPPPHQLPEYELNEEYAQMIESCENPMKFSDDDFCIEKISSGPRGFGDVANYYMKEALHGLTFLEFMDSNKLNNPYRKPLIPYNIKDLDQMFENDSN